MNSRGIAGQEEADHQPGFHVDDRQHAEHAEGADQRFRVEPARPDGNRQPVWRHEKESPWARAESGILTGHAASGSLYHRLRSRSHPFSGGQGIRSESGTDAQR